MSSVGMQRNAEDFAFFSEVLVNGVSIREGICTYGLNILCVCICACIYIWFCILFPSQQSVDGCS